MGLYECIRDIAKSRGYSINRLEKELGFARSSINKFNKNIPSVDKLQQIADLLEVSLDDLMTGETSSDKKGTALTAKDERDIAKDLDRIMGEIRKGDDGPLYYNGVEISEASLGLLQNAIEYALRETKKENKEKYNPNKNKK
ncbi:transcriptional regulator [Lachnoclostridium sp. An14]|uniref:helix-turn-helix domain-containing protein n=1 Tax=Lachnoclostridium sp. An14 TaxID=1965562 RepID=UPI000B3AE3B7|nr:helix-turn-helix transcriptional regulator [Lachnoclostridium sp. An14]OUQ17643.1 transcriptional regulator [Lachnoclostridium sp. An14]